MSNRISFNGRYKPIIKNPESKIKYFLTRYSEFGMLGSTNENQLEDSGKILPEDKLIHLISHFKSKNARSGFSYKLIIEYVL